MADRICNVCDHNKFRKCKSGSYCRMCGSRERSCAECCHTKFEFCEDGSSYCQNCRAEYVKAELPRAPMFEKVIQEKKPRFDYMVQSVFACEIQMAAADLHRILSEVAEKSNPCDKFGLKLSSQKISISTLEVEPEQFTILKNIFGKQSLSFKVTSKDFMIGLRVMAIGGASSLVLCCTTGKKLYLKGGNVESFLTLRNS